MPSIIHVLLATTAIVAALSLEFNGVDSEEATDSYSDGFDDGFFFPSPSPLPTLPLVLPATPPPERPTRLPLIFPGTEFSQDVSYLTVNFSWPLPSFSPTENRFRLDLDTAVTLGLTAETSGVDSFGPGCQRSWMKPRVEATFSGDDSFSPGWEAHRVRLPTDTSSSERVIRLSAAWFDFAPEDFLTVPINITISLSLPGFGGAVTKSIRTYTDAITEGCAAWERDRFNLGADVAVIDLRYKDGIPNIDIIDVEMTAPLPDPYVEPSAEPIVEPSIEPTAELENATFEEDVEPTSNDFYRGEMQPDTMTSEFDHTESGSDGISQFLMEYTGPAVLVTFASLENERELETGIHFGGYRCGRCRGGMYESMIDGVSKIICNATVRVGRQRYLIPLDERSISAGEAELEMQLFARWPTTPAFSAGLANLTVEVLGVNSHAKEKSSAKHSMKFNPVIEPAGRLNPTGFCIYNKIGKVRVVRDKDENVVAETFLIARTEKVIVSQ